MGNPTLFIHGIWFNVQMETDFLGIGMCAVRCGGGYDTFPSGDECADRIGLENETIEKSGEERYCIAYGNRSFHKTSLHEISPTSLQGIAS